MFKLFPLLVVVSVIMVGCSSEKAATAPVKTTIVENKPAPLPAKKEKDIKFLNDISVNASESKTAPVKITETSVPTSGNASALELKYAKLLNTEVDMLSNLKLLEFVDDWYGTRYLMGGTTKSGIDCSAFVQTIYLSAFGVSLPRTAREQFRVSRIISATDLQEGDLLFFNTTGGVSHVGIYLMNNKFVHASSSKGVTVSDVFDPYYLRKYLGAGRIEKPAANSH